MRNTEKLKQTNGENKGIETEKIKRKRNVCYDYPVYLE